MPTEINLTVTDAQLLMYIRNWDPFQRAATEHHRLAAIARNLALQPEPEAL